MPADTGDYLRKRAQELGLDREAVLLRVQAWLEQRYPGQARAVSLNNGALRIIAPNASLASELRLSQTSIADVDEAITRVVISLA